jgi:hypothetical protein
MPSGHYLSITASHYLSEACLSGNTCSPLWEGRRGDHVGTGGVNTAPLASVVSAAVSFANPSNVGAVFTAGEVRKWSRTLVGHDLRGARGMAEASRERLLKANGLTLDLFSAGPL